MLLLGEGGEFYSLGNLAQPLIGHTARVLFGHYQCRADITTIHALISERPFFAVRVGPEVACLSFIVIRKMRESDRPAKLFAFDCEC